MTWNSQAFKGDIMRFPNFYGPSEFVYNNSQ